MGERIHSRPSFAYAFHTAFVAEGLERVTMRQLDIFDQTVLPATPAAQAAFFMDVTFDEEVSGTKATCATASLSGCAAAMILNHLCIPSCRSSYLFWSNVQPWDAAGCKIYCSRLAGMRSMLIWRMWDGCEKSGPI